MEKKGVIPMISFDDRSNFRRTVAAYNEQLMQLHRRSRPQPSPEPTPPEQTLPEQAPPAPTPLPEAPLHTPAEPEREMSTGYLQFFTTAARMAAPVPRAHITVTRDGAPVATAFTDLSGLSPVLSLPAVDSRYSLEPGNRAPYTVYSATVSADGYYSQVLEALELYGGTTALQPVSLIPLPIGTVSGSTTVTDTPPAL